MVRTRTLIALGAVLTICACEGSSYTKQIELKPHGTAVRANMAAQIINPLPPTRSARTSDAARAVIGLDAYRTGEVKDPTSQSTAPATTIIEEVN